MLHQRIKLFLLFLSASTLVVAQDNFGAKLALAALTLTEDHVTYDPSYFSIAYPNGDIPSNKGVCTDVIIRAYRKLHIDLQKEVHVDMKKHFNLYPNHWGLKTTDKNIDHRRVPNLMVLFKRFGISKSTAKIASDYLPGDIVCWNLRGGITHIGIVSTKKSRDGKRPLIIHNIGAGQVLQDCIFDFKIIGHFSYPK